MVLSDRHLPIRQLVGAVLGYNNNELSGAYSCSAIADLCNIFMPNAVVLKRHVQDAFSGEGDNVWTHLSPADIGLDSSLNMFNLAFIKQRIQQGGSRVRRLIIGCYDSADSVPSISQIVVTLHVNIARLRRLGLLPPSQATLHNASQLVGEIERKRSAREKSKRKRESDQRRQSEPEPEPQPQPPTIKEQIQRQSLLLKRLLEQRRDLDKLIARERDKYLDLRRQDGSVAQDELDVFESNDETDKKQVLLLVDGRPGSLDISPGSLFLYEDIEQSLLSHEECSNKPNTECRQNQYRLNWWGSKGCWVPKGTNATSTRYLSLLRNLAAPTKKLIGLFKGKQTRFSRHAGRIMSLFFLKATRASGAAKEAIMCGTLKGLVHDIGLGHLISDEQLARGVPCENTIANWELDVAALCMAKNVNEILQEKNRRGKPVVIAAMTDHANRKGVGFFAKVLIWSVKCDGKWGLTFFCLDIDNSDHTAQGATQAIKHSLGRLGLRLGQDYIFQLLTGDAGGGAAVQRLHPELKRIDVMGPLSRSTRCMMHGLNKSFEMGCLDCFGTQGINHRTVTQMFWLVIQMFMKLKQDGGMRLFDETYAAAVEMMTSDYGWEAMGQKNFLPAMDNWYSNIEEEFDELTDEGIEAKAKFLSCAPRNITQPTLGRWKSVSSTGKVCKHFYPIIFFMGLVIVRADKSKNYVKYLRTIACEMCSLMIVQPESETSEQQTSISAVYKPGDTPPMYALTLWFVGFCEEYFDDMFDWAMRDDPILGRGSYGQLARLCPERAYVMHRDLSELEDGGWKTKQTFKQYLTALDGVKMAGAVRNGGREFVEKVPEQFLRTYRHFLNKHALVPWTSPELVVLVVGGNKHLAKHFLRRIFNRHSYNPPNELIRLHHHQTSKGPVYVNINAAIEYLIGDHLEEAIDSCKLFNDPLIQDHLEEWRCFAESNVVVDLFDESTWPEGQSFEVLQSVVYEEIMPLASHQQRIENYIQMAGLVAETGCGEARCTWRAILQVGFMRPFNQAAIQYATDVKAEEEREEEDPNNVLTEEELFDPGKKVRRVRGRLLMQLLCKETSLFLSKCNNACIELGDDRVKAIKESLQSTKNKTSTLQREKAIKEMRNEIKKKKEPTKAETKKGIDVPANIGGAVLVSMISYKHMDGEKKANEILRAELEARGKIYTNKQWKEMNWREKKNILKTHESGERVMKRDQGQEGIVAGKVESIIPQSDAMKQFLEQLKETNRRLDSLEKDNYE